MSTQTFVGTLTIIDCPACGMAFGITKDFEDRRRADHADFYCPRKHPMSYGGKSDTEKARDEAEALRRRLAAANARETATRDQLEATERSLRGHKAAKTRIRNRIAAGVCPCCGRSFQNLRRHMDGQHPNFTTKED